MKTIHPDIACKECQIAANQAMKGAYNLACNDCCARYAIDMIGRLAGARAAVVRTMVYQALAKECS